MCRSFTRVTSLALSFTLFLWISPTSPSLPTAYATSPHSLGQTPAVDARRDAKLEGTLWDVTIEGWDPARQTFEFLKGGKLRYSYTTAMGEAHTDDNATWTQSGGSLAVEINDAHSELKGTVSGDRIEGTISNARGKRSAWVATRRKAS